MRILAVLLSVTLLIACGSPKRERVNEEGSVQKETEITDQPQEHRDPDGAFGAKDFASEAKQQSDQNTRALEDAADQTGAEEEQPEEDQ